MTFGQIGGGERIAVRATRQAEFRGLDLACLFRFSFLLVLDKELSVVSSTRGRL